jgi:hypothetical protein
MKSCNQSRIFHRDGAATAGVFSAQRSPFILLEAAIPRKRRIRGVTRTMGFHLDGLLIVHSFAAPMELPHRGEHLAAT